MSFEYSKLAQVGKRRVKNKKVKEWDKARAKLKQEYIERGITACEVCKSTNMLSLAHRHKRRNTTQEELGSFRETLLLCLTHHEQIEYSKEKTEELFRRLRP